MKSLCLFLTSFLLAVATPHLLHAQENYNWHAVGGGVDHHLSSNPFVYGIATIGDELFIGGHFTRVDGTGQYNVGRYNMITGEWVRISSILTSNQVYALAAIGNDLYITGSFTRNFGDTVLNRIARYNIETQTWHSLGEGLNGGGNALLAVGTDLYVGGSFTEAGGITSNSIARYDTETGTWHNLGDGTGSGVRALEYLDGNLYVGGSFNQAGGMNANRIVRYDINSETWHTLGDGIGNGSVVALEFIENNLYVGGSFGMAGESEANRIARYDMEEDTWYSLGDGMNDQVRSLTSINDNLYVGGDFNQAGGVSANRIARFKTDDESWHSLENGVSGNINSRVTALASIGETLFAGGFFRSASGLTVNNIARWSPDRPSILTENPEEDSEKVAVDTIISAEFDMDVTPLDLSGITIEDDAEIPLDGVNVTFDDNIISFPNITFENEAVYKVTIPNGVVRSNAGLTNFEYTWSFKTIMAPPDTLNVTPEDGATDVTIDPDVSAEFNQDITPLELELISISDQEGNDHEGVSAELNNNRLSISHHKFYPGTEYTVTIPSGTVENSDQVVNENISWSFKVPPLPDNLSILSPEDESTQVSTKPVFEWTEADGAISYDFNISTDSEFENNLIEIEDIDDTSYSLTTHLLYQTTYYWRVRAANIAGYSDWSDTTSFTTKDMSPPTLLGPDNGVKAEPPFDLAWEQVENTDIKSSQLFISTDSTFTDNVYFELNLQEPLYTLEPDFDLTITNGDTLYWKVRKQLIEDELNVSEWSDAHSVIINVEAPKIVQPDPDGLHELPVTLQWDADRRNNNYVYEIHITDGRYLVDYDSGLTQTQYSPQLPRTNQQYRWAVQKRSSSNSGLYSEWVSSEFFIKPDFVRLTPDTVFATRPSNVNIFLSARDQDGRGVTTLELDDFQLLENGRTIVEAETNLQVARQDQVDSSLKTVLLLNNSLSIGEENIEVIREAAKEFVRNKTPEQQIAIKFFAESSELVMPFSKDEEELLDALSQFRLTDTPGTDVNGSVVRALDLWDDEFSFNNINQGYLLLFTDGRDLAGTTSLEQVINARGTKQVFAVGVQNRPEDFDEPALREIGNAGVIIEDDFSNLIFNFLEIQERLEQLSNSFYWFNYSSARRSNDGELNVRIGGNQNTGPDSEINVFFDASEFYGVPVDIIVNGTPENPRGVDEVYMAGDDTLGVRIETAFSFELLPFEFDISDPTKLEIEPVGDDSFIFNFIGNGLEGDEIEIAIADTASPTLNLEKTLTVRFGERQTGPPTAALLTPDDEADQVALNPLFEWSEVTGAENYRFQLSTDDDFDSLHSDELLTETDFTPVEPLSREMIYYWRVRVENSNESSRWSTVRSFTTRERAMAEDLRAEVQDGAVILSWNSDQLDEEDLFEIHGGESADEMALIAELPFDVRSYSENLNAGHLYALRIAYADGSESPFSNTVTFSEESFRFTPEWDLVSISINSDQATLSSSELYSFAGAYSSASSLQPASGYWVRSDDSEELLLAGDGLSEATYSLRRGWNLIGALASETDLSALEDPESILTASPVFGYSDGIYTEATTLNPGRGYWLYAADEGQVSLSLSAGEQGPAPVAAAAARETDDLHRIRFTNAGGSQTLFASEMPLDERASQPYRMPPVAPDPGLDVRSGEFRLTDRRTAPLQITTRHYPVRVMLDAEPEAFESDYIYRILAHEDGNEVHYNLLPGQEVAISRPYEEVILEHVHREDAITEFAIEPNYPNPFNPTTTIRYQLAGQADVGIMVYDILGRRVATLVNATQQAGIYTVSFDANHLASGVYMLRIQAGSFTDIQTMTLIK